MNKKQLYEKIMRNVAREVKRALNENFGDNIEYADAITLGRSIMNRVPFEKIYSK